MVDVVSEWEDGSERLAPRFRIVSYDTPRGCAAAYYPETNVLIPLDHTAIGSNCPSSKSVVVRLERRGLVLRELAEGQSLHSVQARTGAPLHVLGDVGTF